MNFNIKNVKISVTIPEKNVKEIRNAICKIGAGIIGNYTYCTLSSKCLGTFKPNEEADPYIGEKNKMEFLKEIKLETTCKIESVKKIITKIREIHPYEEPVIDIIPLMDDENFK